MGNQEDASPLVSRNFWPTFLTATIGIGVRGQGLWPLKVAHKSLAL